MTLQAQNITSIDQVRGFVLGTESMIFLLTDRKEASKWMADTLRHFGYANRSREHKGLLRLYLAKVTGLSRAQVARCIRDSTGKKAPWWIDVKSRRTSLGHPPPGRISNCWQSLIRSTKNPRGRPRRSSVSGCIAFSAISVLAPIENDPI